MSPLALPGFGYGTPDLEEELAAAEVGGGGDAGAVGAEDREDAAAGQWLTEQLLPVRNLALKIRLNRGILLGSYA